jgi:uncharacterized OsmC-like protein
VKIAVPKSVPQHKHHHTSTVPSNRLETPRNDSDSDSFDGLPNHKMSSLREKQAPLKDSYRSDPNSAIVTLKSTGTLDSSNVTCKLDTGKQMKQAQEKVAGLHPFAGGDDPEISGELCSGDMLLEALVACAGVTLKAVSTAMGIPIASGIVKAEGDLDFKGTMGIDRNAPVGFKDIRLSFELRFEDGVDVPEEKVAKLGQLTERYCVVLQTIAKKPELSVSLQGSQKQEAGEDKQFSWEEKH